MPTPLFFYIYSAFPCIACSKRFTIITPAWITLTVHSFFPFSAPSGSIQRRCHISARTTTIHFSARYPFTPGWREAHFVFTSCPRMLSTWLQWESNRASPDFETYALPTRPRQTTCMNMKLSSYFILT